ncbi:hypothetical protein LCGC14_0318040 [marine sediment metagenome]|uniref:HTH cro/C1-type domain-containing protein n=1 Tax=marine sediment metagenome TaxID=412755 RepID=A0A0F9TJY8_9ZZZZ
MKTKYDRYRRSAKESGEKQVSNHVWYLCQLIKKYREDSGVNAISMAERIGVSRSTIYRMGNYKVRRLQVRVRKLIAKFVGSLPCKECGGLLPPEPEYPEYMEWFDRKLLNFPTRCHSCQNGYMERRRKGMNVRSPAVLDG